MRRLVPVLLAVGLLVVGCTPGGGTPSPSPSSAVVVSPSPSATPTPTPSAVSSEDALYAEAERVYVAYLKAQWKYELTGDYSEFPAELADYLDDVQLIVARHDFETAKAAGWRMVGGEPKVSLTRAPDIRHEDSIATLLVCYDAVGLTVLDTSGSEVHQGGRYELNVFFRHAIDGKLKIFSQGGGSGVSQCAG